MSVTSKQFKPYVPLFGCFQDVLCVCSCIIVGVNALSRGGGHLVPTMSGSVCPKVKGIGLFQLQGSEIRENISLKMGVKFTASLNMGKNLC